MTENSMPTAPRIFVVRAEVGKYADDFKKGGYVAIGWLPNTNLSQVHDKNELKNLYETLSPDGVTPMQIGNQVGQISRFMFDIKAGDYILTPTAETEWINWGIVLDETYTFAIANDGCPFPHRRNVKWNKESLRRSDFSVPLKNTMRALLTLFEISKSGAKSGEIFELMGKPELINPVEARSLLMHEVVIERILEQDAEFFELLVADLLRAMGFDAQHKGKSGDGGVDAEGVLDMGGLAQIDLKVQAKRYAGAKINGSVIISFRGSIPNSSQGAFITTSDYSKSAREAAQDAKFKRVNLINGRQLVDLLAEHWDELSPEIKIPLGLQKSWLLS
ncbi:hypothetical protein EHF33_04415 [Deinococcus psychrotolerans]|uniref:Restriction endonuclease type IV Mrr domain-containing protein n=1 Tax=Deinococcus psychrotolerans TaxID=2489213 RepID=A0A3G8Y9P5_9DEIO|nr:restriction endonuclease [Deinococcus psychrotolerans]AZI42082.1 hypothetical protein EHF33_04415 [Deinococcus psychrotolerans]